MANQLVEQGVLNRLRASIIFNDFPSLNVTPPFLGQDAISISFQGDATTSIPTQTGVVQSPEPYQPAMVSIALLKTQGLAAQWQTQQLLSTLVGQCIVRPDVSQNLGIQPFPLFNCAIQGVRDLSFSGRDAGYVVSLTGIYYLNAALWG